MENSLAALSSSGGMGAVLREGTVDWVAVFCVSTLTLASTRDGDKPSVSKCA